MRHFQVYCLRVCLRQSLSLCEWCRTLWRTEWVWHPLSNVDKEGICRLAFNFSISVSLCCPLPSMGLIQIQTVHLQTSNSRSMFTTHHCLFSFFIVSTWLLLPLANWLHYEPLTWLDSDWTYCPIHAFVPS